MLSKDKGDCNTGSDDSMYDDSLFIDREDLLRFFFLSLCFFLETVDDVLTESESVSSFFLLLLLRPLNFLRRFV